MASEPSPQIKPGSIRLDGLPEGDYTVQLAVPDGQTAGDFGDQSTTKIHLKRGDVVERNFNLFWNGRIDGQVKDDSGSPAHAWIELQSSDGSQLPGYVRNFVSTNPDGSYEVKKIPPGRYFVAVNPYGPSDESPYGVQYYPVAVRAQNARTFEIGPGQEIRGVNFAVPRLMKRTVRVLVKWPDGKPADNAWVYVWYPHTKDAVDFRRTDHTGNAELDVFGDSVIRIFAEIVVDDGALQGATRYSVPVEVETTKLPTGLTLVLSTSTLRKPSQP